jgi:hypothetical protein
MNFNERQYINESYADVVSTYDNTKKFIISQADFLAPRNITDFVLLPNLPTYMLYRYSEPVIKYMPYAMNEIKSNPSGTGYLFGSGSSKVASAFIAPGAIGAGYKVINVSTKALVYASTKGAPMLFSSVKKLGGLKYFSIQPQAGTQLIWQQASKSAQAAADASFASGSIGAAKVWATKARIKAAQLPTEGKIRFVPDKNYRPSKPINRGKNNGYIDRFNNEWIAGPSRTPGELFEWDIQLSALGKKKIGWASRDGNHVNVSLKGRITHE